MGTIFVSIASCKEEFLVQTIKSAISNAQHPELIYFGISNMVIDNKDFLVDPIFDMPNIKYVETKHKEPLGTGFGRMAASLMHDREHDYLLQVDAQNIFEKGWDVILKNYYKKLLTVCDKPIISTSPQRWVEGSNGEVFLFEKNNKSIDPYDFKTDHTFSSIGIKIVSKKNELNDGTFDEYAYIDGVHHDWSDDEDFTEHGLIFGSFMFASFSFIRDVMHDPTNPWDGDQINLSFRAGTRGYRMFAIKDCLIWSKDKFTRNGDLISSDDWRLVEKKEVGLFNAQKSKQIQRDIFSGNYIGYWGAPTKESIKEYYSKIGIELSKFFI